MRQVAKRGILTAVATGSVLASTAGYAYAGAEAQGGAMNSPGVGAGNAVQAPVDIPVNACGNTVNVVGLLNPAMGNSCGNSTRSLPVQGSPAHGHPTHMSAGHMGAGHMGSGQAGPGSSDQWHPGEGHLHPGSTYGSSASGVAHGSPGVAAGNQVQAPISVPVNACGNSVDVIGLGNPAFGNDCANQAAPAPAPVTTPAPTPPPPAPGDDCTPGGPGPGTGAHNPPPPTMTPPTVTPPSVTPPASTPPGSTPPANGAPGSGRNGGPTQVTPVSAPGAGSTSGTGSGTSADSVRIPAQPAQSLGTPSGAAPSAAAPLRAQLASTGAAGVELLGSAGAALMLAGGVLYRRSRAGVR